VLNKTFIVD